MSPAIRADCSHVKFHTSLCVAADCQTGGYLWSSSVCSLLSNQDLHTQQGMVKKDYKESRNPPLDLLSGSMHGSASHWPDGTVWNRETGLPTGCQRELTVTGALPGRWLWD